MKVVLDSNVLIAAFGTRGLCAEVFEYCLAQHEIVIGASIMNEVGESLREDFRISSEKVKERRAFLISNATVVVSLEVPRTICRDPDDAHILGAAWAAKADVIVTGDKDLLEVKEFKGVEILSVRSFWERRAT